MTLRDRVLGKSSWVGTLGSLPTLGRAPPTGINRSRFPDVIFYSDGSTPWRAVGLLI